MLPSADREIEEGSKQERVSVVRESRRADRIGERTDHDLGAEAERALSKTTSKRKNQLGVHAGGQTES